MGTKSRSPRNPGNMLIWMSTSTKYLCITATIIIIIIAINITAIISSTGIVITVTWYQYYYPITITVLINIWCSTTGTLQKCSYTDDPKNHSYYSKTSHPISVPLTLSQDHPKYPSTTLPSEPLKLSKVHTSHPRSLALHYQPCCIVTMGCEGVLHKRAWIWLIYNNNVSTVSCEIRPFSSRALTKNSEKKVCFCLKSEGKERENKNHKRKSKDWTTSFK